MDHSTGDLASSVGIYRDTYPAAPLLAAAGELRPRVRRRVRSRDLGRDDELVRRCLAGDEAGWRELVSKYRRLIYSVAIKCGATPSEADDIFQGVCLVLLEKLGTLREASKLGIWLMTTTSRMSWNVVAERRSNGNGGPPASWPEALLAESLLEGELARIEMQDAVRWAIEQLPERCRTVIHCLFYQDEPLSYKEIGRRLGISPGSVGPTRARCLEKVRVMLKRMGYR